MKPSPVGRVALLLFGSGLCALIYQIAWLRELRLVFGASTAASAAVLGIFMGGLGAGGLVFGKRAATAARPLLLYARLEAAIAIASALTPLFVLVARWLYAAVGGTPALGLGGGTVARLVLAAVVLGVPTLLMGGTLPAAAQAVTRAGDVGRRDLAILYGSNTLGAVAGATLSTFVLLEMLGTRRMLLSACVLNLVVAAIATLLATRIERSGRGRSRSRRRSRSRSRSRLTEVRVGGGGDCRVRVFVDGAGLVSNAGAAARRQRRSRSGSSSRSRSPASGLGGVAYALFGGSPRGDAVRGSRSTCALEAAGSPFRSRSAIASRSGRRRCGRSAPFGFCGFVAGWTAIAAIVVFPAAFVSGVQFPLLIALLGRGRERRRAAGRLRLCVEHGRRDRRLARRRLRPDAAARRARLLAPRRRAPALRRPRRRRRSPTSRGRRELAVPILAAGIALGLRRRPRARRPRGATRPIGAGRAPRRARPTRSKSARASSSAARAGRRDGVEIAVALDAQAGLGVRRQRQGRRQRALGRADAGDGGPARRARAPGAQPRAGDRPRHRQRPRAGSAQVPTMRARRRRRARAGDPRRGRALRAGQPRRARRTRRCTSPRRRARDAASRRARATT